MSKNISIRYGQTGGDQTSVYFITLKKSMTVGEFITEWLTEEQGEWGYFGIYKANTYFGEPRCEYSHGKIVGENMAENYLHKEIKKVYGSGGWSRSDFIFEV